MTTDNNKKSECILQHDKKTLHQCFGIDDARVEELHSKLNELMFDKTRKYKTSIVIEDILVNTDIASNEKFYLIYAFACKETMVQQVPKMMMVPSSLTKGIKEILDDLEQHLKK